MIISRATSLALLALALPFATVVADDDDDDDDDSPIPDDDGPIPEFRCYYDDQCLFPCAEVDDPSECLNYVFSSPQRPNMRKMLEEHLGERKLTKRLQGLLDYMEQGRSRSLQTIPPLDLPYYMSDFAADATCGPTSDDPEPVGVCCPSCAIEDIEGDDCTEYYVNPDSCKNEEGRNYFVDVIKELQTNSYDGACYSVNSGGGTDPHIKTLPANAPALDMEIHVRTRVRYDYAFIESMALRMKDDVLVVNSWGDYSLNGVLRADLKGLTFAGYAITHRVVSEKQNDFDIQLGGNEKIILSAFKDLVTVHLIDATKEHFGDAKGLMGDFGGKLMARDGRILSEEESSNETSINAFAQTWQVQADEDMLFETVRAPLAGEQCRYPDVTMAAKRRRLGESLAADAAAKACAHLTGKAFDNCVFDVVAVGDVDIAQAGAY